MDYINTYEKGVFTMKNAKKLMAAVAAATTAMTSLAMTSISASAYDYNDYYDTYRFYVELAPASGMRVATVLISNPRSIFTSLNFSNQVQGNVEGRYSISGTANDNWTTHVDIFEAPYDLVEGGVLCHWDCYTKVAAVSAWDIFRLSAVSIQSTAGNKVPSSFISVYGVKVGDINEDGVVDWGDVTAINNHLTGLTLLSDNPLRAADTNNDGYVNTNDMQTLVSYLSGNIEHF